MIHIQSNTQGGQMNLPVHNRIKSSMENQQAVETKISSNTLETLISKVQFKFSLVARTRFSDQADAEGSPL